MSNYLLKSFVVKYFEKNHYHNKQKMFFLYTNNKQQMVTLVYLHIECLYLTNLINCIKDVGGQCFHFL